MGLYNYGIGDLETGNLFRLGRRTFRYLPKVEGAAWDNARRWWHNNADSRENPAEAIQLPMVHEHLGGSRRLWSLVGLSGSCLDCGFVHWCYNSRKAERRLI